MVAKLFGYGSANANTCPTLLANYRKDHELTLERERIKVDWATEKCFNLLFLYENIRAFAS
jgi:hypothetical protein